MVLWVFDGNMVGKWTNEPCNGVDEVVNHFWVLTVVMDEIHQAPYSGHLGYQKTIATARKKYFWSGMKKDMVEYISRCMKC